jgi:CheY-like chemotaxis protein
LNSWGDCCQVLFWRTLEQGRTVQMLPRQKEPSSKSVSPESGIQEMRQSSVAAERLARSNEGIPATEANSVAQFRFRILVVDDEPSIRETARQILESQGYEVLTAADGLDGLHALNKSLPDLIVSDLNMPRMSGFEFLGIVRKRFPHIATIAVVESTSKLEIQPEYWPTLSCKRDNIQ